MVQVTSMAQPKKAASMHIFPCFRLYVYVLIGCHSNIHDANRELQSTQKLLIIVAKKGNY
jgi:hypothetical protein